MYLLVMVSQAVYGQQRVFMGRVVDKDQHSIPYAVVQAKGRNEGVYCDERGVFAFTADASVVRTIVVSCLGYEQRELNTDIIPNDSILVVLQSRVASLRAVKITAQKGPQQMGVLGKSRHHERYEGDCYRYYGSETAIKLKGDTSKHAYLDAIYVYVTSDGDFTSHFRVHAYEWGELPEHELTDSSVVVHGEHGDSWVKADVSKLNIPVGAGLFLSVEWISGYGNSKMTLQSATDPDITGYNGQVIGLTTDYGKPSKTYSRKPFSDKWTYYDSPDAMRKGGYFLNPMIYATIRYAK